MHTCVHAYMRVCVHALMHTCIYMYCKTLVCIGGVEGIWFIKNDYVPRHEKRTKLFRKYFNHYKNYTHKKLVLMVKIVTIDYKFQKLINFYYYFMDIVEFIVIS